MSSWPNFNWNRLEVKEKFNDLCMDLLPRIVEGALDLIDREGRDKGRDGQIRSGAVIRYSAVLHELPGWIVIQYKWRNPGDDHNKNARNVEDSMIKDRSDRKCELNREWRTDDPGRYKGYILLTNVCLTSTQKQNIEEAFERESVQILIMDQPNIEAAVHAFPAVWHHLMDDPTVVPVDIHKKLNKSALVDYDYPYVDLCGYQQKLLEWLDDSSKHPLLLLTSREGGMGKSHLLIKTFEERLRPKETVLWLDQEEMDLSRLTQSIREAAQEELILVIDKGIEDVDERELLGWFRKRRQERAPKQFRLVLSTREYDASRWRNISTIMEGNPPSEISFQPLEHKQAVKLFDALFVEEGKRRGLTNPTIPEEPKELLVSRAEGIPMMIMLYAKAAMEGDPNAAVRHPGLLGYLKLRLERLEAQTRFSAEHRLQFLAWFMLTGPVRQDRWSRWQGRFSEASSCQSDIDRILKDMISQGFIRESLAYYSLQPPPLADALLEHELLDASGEIKPRYLEGLQVFFVDFPRAIARNIARADHSLPAEGRLMAALHKLVQLTIESLISDGGFAHTAAYTNPLEAWVRVIGEILPSKPRAAIDLLRMIVDKLDPLESNIVERITLTLDHDIYFLRFRGDWADLLPRLIDLIVVIDQKVDPNARHFYTSGNPKQLVIKMFSPMPPAWWMPNCHQLDRWPDWRILLEELERRLSLLDSAPLFNVVMSIFEGLFTADWRYDWSTLEKVTFHHGSVVYTNTLAEMRTKVLKLFEQLLRDKASAIYLRQHGEQVTDLMTDSFGRSLRIVIGASRSYFEECEKAKSPCPFALEELDVWESQEYTELLNLCEVLLNCPENQLPLKAKRKLQLRLLSWIGFNWVPQMLINKAKDLAKWSPTSLQDKLYFCLLENAWEAAGAESGRTELQQRQEDCCRELIEILCKLQPESAVFEVANSVLDHGDPKSIYGKFKWLFVMLGERLSAEMINEWWAAWDALPEKQHSALIRYIGYLVAGKSRTNQVVWHNLMEARLKELANDNVTELGPVITAMFTGAALDTRGITLFAKYIEALRQFVSNPIEPAEVPLDMNVFQDIWYQQDQDGLAVSEAIAKFIDWHPDVIGRLITGLLNYTIHAPQGVERGVPGLYQDRVIKLWFEIQLHVPKLDSVQSEMYLLYDLLVSSYTRQFTDALVKRAEHWIELKSRPTSALSHWDNQYEVFPYHLLSLFEHRQVEYKDNPWTVDELRDRLEYLNDVASHWHLHLPHVVELITDLSRLPAAQILQIFWGDELRLGPIGGDSELVAKQIDRLIEEDAKSATFAAFETTEKLLDMDHSSDAVRMLAHGWTWQRGVHQLLDDGTSPKVRDVLDYLDHLPEEGLERRYPDFWEQVRRIAETEQQCDRARHQRDTEIWLSGTE